MNDIEKAIEMIDKVWHPGKYLNEADNELHVDADELDKACELAISALEKQIPKKTYYLNYGGYNVGNWNHGIACICDYKAPYCRYCGQKLDWEVENE